MKKIPLTQGKFALVDDADYDWLSKWKWYAHKNRKTYYALRKQYVSRKVRYCVAMHRAILGLKAGDGKQGDHRDHNGLNNRKSNLRICTNQQNQFNKKKLRKCTSLYKGVTRQAGRTKWVARAYCDGQCRYIGSFASEIDAAHAYDAKAIELFGEFAKTNF